MYDLKGYGLKNSLADMTVAEFEAVATILKAPETEAVERYFNLLEYLGVPSAILDDLTDEDLFAAIKAFSGEAEQSELLPSIEIEGYTYVAYEAGTEFRLKARDLAYIEKAIKVEKAFLSQLLAIVFKREDLTVTEHYTRAHIDHKAKLFGTLNAGDMYPYLLYITDRLNKQLQKHAERPQSTGSATPAVPE